MTGTARCDVEALEAALAASQARVSAAEAQIASLTLMIEKLRRALYGQRSERKERLLNQLELALDDLTADAGEDDLAAEKAAAATTEVKGFVRRAPSRKPFPEHLPRERVVVPGPTACTCCGSERLSKIGEDITETLEVIPRRWKVIQTVREKFSCRECETDLTTARTVPRDAARLGGSQPAGDDPLREVWGASASEPAEGSYAREGIDLSISTLADQVGACAVALKPLHELIVAHVLAAGRLHGDDTPVPVLAKGKTDTARAWVYVRDDQPFAGPDPPAALFRYSRDRSGDHPVEHLRAFTGISAGRRLCRLPAALRARPLAGARHGSAVLVARPAQVLRARRHCGREEARQAGAADLAAGFGGCEAHRRDLRYRARDQRRECRASPRRAPGAERAARRRSSRSGCVRSVLNSRATPPWPRRWITC